ncbi:MAG: thymidylate synthase (FAD) [Ignavibacteriae bacterium HGW-Ignavibacteriae-4]|jgi:thymidylate synthase (FAD)|nr:MAG: thymidylate synthase (FAD) [Ignavibacteriae bacterium HGW-Ignavibacteriae-4]
MSKENLIGKEIKCLDHGFVRLVDVMGDDGSIVQAARVSYGAGTKTVNEDRGLIRYLMRHKHTTPFEMVEFKFHIKLPIFIARQWIRHRTANVNEYSGRYSIMKDDFYLPDIEQIRPQSEMNKQGRSDETFTDEKANAIREKLGKVQKELYTEYESLLGEELARELARINLPLSNYTEWYWKIDLHNLFHFLRLRIDSHAQYEIRVYGEALAGIVKEIVPHAWQAFEDYSLNSANFSKPELNAMKRLLEGQKVEDLDLDEIGLSKREFREFQLKLEQINQ